MTIHDALKFGELHENSGAIKVVRPRPMEGVFTNATILEEVDKLTLRGTLRSFIDTSSMEDSRCVDEDWHAMCQAHLQGCRGRGLE